MIFQKQHPGKTAPGFVFNPIRTMLYYFLAKRGRANALLITLKVPVVGETMA